MKLPLRATALKIALPSLAATLLLAGGAYAFSEHKDIAAKLGGVAGDVFDLDGAMRVNSLVVGDQGTGGVTFFNGTIVNSTTGDGGSNNPVAFGDNVRIDGDLYNGADGIPLKITDDIRITGDVDLQGDLAADNIYTKTEVDASLADKADADAVVTKASPSWTARTGKISIAAAAFTPANETTDFAKSDKSLNFQSGVIASFYAPLQLPDGATITEISLDYIDNIAGIFTMYLEGTDGSTTTQIADVSTSGASDPALRTVSSTTIADGTVDNDTNAYYLQLIFGADGGASSLSFRRAEITYTYTQPN